MSLRCGGACGDPYCTKAYDRQCHFDYHVRRKREALATERASVVDELQCREIEEEDSSEDGSAGSDGSVDEPASEMEDDSLLDEAALLYARLDNEHLQHAVIVRIFEAMTPYVTAVAERCMCAARAGSPPDMSAADLIGPVLQCAVRTMSKADHGQQNGGAVRRRLRKMNFLDPTEVHARPAPAAVGGSVYEVDLVEDLLQMLQQDEQAAVDFATADRRWREMAQAIGSKWKTVGATRPRSGTELINHGLSEALKTKQEFVREELDSYGVKGLRADHFIGAGDQYFQPDELPLIISDVEDSVLFRERVLPVMRALQPDQLLLVALPYMDDVDVCNQKGASSGVHQQNMQYVTYLNFSPMARTHLHHIRLVACCPTHLTHNKQAGFSFVISDLGDRGNKGMSLGAQFRRLRDGKPFDLSDKVPALRHIRTLFGMCLFLEGDNKGLNEAYSFSGSFGPLVWSYCRQCFDLREKGAAVQHTDNAIISKWHSRQQCRGEVGSARQVERFLADRGAGWLRGPALFKELQADIKTLHQSGKQGIVPHLLQMLGAHHQLNEDGSEKVHGYSGVPFLALHWDVTKPPDGMHDWLLGWCTMMGGAFVSLALLRGWISNVDEVNEATQRHFANLSVQGPRTKLKPSGFTSTWYDPCKDCETSHTHVRKRRVVPGEAKLPWHAADTLHWMLHSLNIYLLIPRMRQELCKPYAEMDPAVYAYVLHIEVLGRLLAYRFVCSELPQLEKAVALALEKYKSIPEYVLLLTKAKIHSCTHTVLFILICGPLRYWWCMRQEGKHQPLKALAVRCNFKNVSLSVAEGAMRQLAYMYSFQRGNSQAVKNRGGKLAHGVGLSSSAAITVEAVEWAIVNCPLLDPQHAAYHVTHWEHSTCHVGGTYRRLQTMVMIRSPREPGGRADVFLCMVTGGLDAVATQTQAHGTTQATTFTALVVHILPQQVMVAAHSQWTLHGREPELRHQLRSLKGSSVVLTLPVRVHHPDIDLIPVSVYASPQNVGSMCAIVPTHSGFA